MSTTALMLPATDDQSLADWSAVAFVASYSSPGTRQAYATQLRLWFQWCRAHGLEPLTDVRRPHVELYDRDLEARGLAPATAALKLIVLTGARPVVEVAPSATGLGVDDADVAVYGEQDHACAVVGPADTDVVTTPVHRRVRAARAASERRSRQRPAVERH